MKQETLKMSRRERERLVVMSHYKKGEILLKEAALEMNLSIRQTIRIKKRFMAEGAEGLVHRSRDMPSNSGFSKEYRNNVLEIYKSRYHDFGPTLASEKMADNEKVKVHRETLRRWLINDFQWQTGKKGRKHRKKRKRRDCFGEMLQIDGSEHAWFEERAEKCALMVLIDDATNTMMLHMAPTETTEAALTILRKWVLKQGVPGSIYADRRTIYFTEEYIYDPGRRKDPETFTRFIRVADRLKIDMIPAYSAQAKGRVERANGLLQDRLVKELRLREINTIDEANAMLDSFAQEMNQRFAKEPACPANAHRSAPSGRRQLDFFFCYEDHRKVQKDNTVVFKNAQWQILKQEGVPNPGKTVTLRTPIQGGKPHWLYNEKRLKTRYLGVSNPRKASSLKTAGFIALEFKDENSGIKTKASGPHYPQPTRPSPNPAMALGSLPSVALSSRQASKNNGKGK